MKISSILETIVNTEIKPDQRYHGHLRQDKDKTSDDEFNGSAFSKVKPIKNEPHMVRKYNHRPMDTNSRNRLSVDGFNLFIEQLIERGETDNIHFPRVYSIKKIVDDDNQYIHTYNIEKLLSSYSLSKQELLKICEESFGEDADSVKFDKDQLEEIITGKINYALRHNYYDDITSESLLEALKILNNIVKYVVKLKRGHRLDLHSKNIMYRRTPTGIQLVINDPIA